MHNLRQQTVTTTLKISVSKIKKKAYQAEVEQEIVTTANKKEKHLGNIISQWKEICNLCNFMLPFLRAQDPQTTFNFHIWDDEKAAEILSFSFFLFRGYELTRNSPRCENFMSFKLFAMREDGSHKDVKIKKITLNAFVFIVERSWWEKNYSSASP